MKKETSWKGDTKFYFHKYPWIFYLVIINTISSFLLSAYGEGLFRSETSKILSQIIIEVISILILIMVFVLIAKHVFDRYFTTGEEGYVYFPTWFFVAGVCLEFLFIFLYSQNILITLSENLNIYNSIFMLIMSLILFIVYRKKN